MKKMEARKSVNKLVDKLGIGFGEAFIKLILRLSGQFLVP